MHYSDLWNYSEDITQKEKFRRLEGKLDTKSYDILLLLSIADSLAVIADNLNQRKGEDK